MAGGGGGGLARTISQNSRTLSPGVSKISDFSFMPFGHMHCGEISGQLICQGDAAVIFRTRDHEK